MPCSHHEIREDTKTALEIAQTALDEGLEDLDALTENARAYKDAALILKKLLIKDNISMWQSYDFVPRGRLVVKTKKTKIYRKEKWKRQSENNSQRRTLKSKIKKKKKNNRIQWLRAKKTENRRSKNTIMSNATRLTYLPTR